MPHLRISLDFAGARWDGRQSWPGHRLIGIVQGHTLIAGPEVHFLLLEPVGVSVQHQPGIFNPSDIVPTEDQPEL
jgi:hypothetical protein